MLHLVRIDRAYPPKTVALMTTAPDRASPTLSTWINESEVVRGAAILRHIDLGERDPVRLAGATGGWWDGSRLRLLTRN
jgi:hypothetical protein